MDITTVGNSSRFIQPVAPKPEPEPPSSGAGDAAKAVAPTVTTQAVQQAAATIAADQSRQAAQNAAKAMESPSRNLEFALSEDNRAILRVVDEETGDVVRQVPSREALELAKALERLQDSPVSKPRGSA